ncbi:type IV pilus assembly protein PilF [Moraxella cuniculi DSM 21768]|uniref:Type IV pilus assembly protein PilF n=2 Tax=Moraxella cuniculi TaxID=34061 RepID=A0A1N7ETY5_9GAMM|nr:type IV pilus assembly protein PilF [Moraxella cuniculi DSM 21768]
MQKIVMVLVILMSLSACQSTPSGTNHNNQSLAVIYTEIAEQLLVAGEIDAAKNQLDRVFKLNKNHAAAYRVLANIYQATQDDAYKQQARTLYKKAIALNETDMQNYMDYGLYLVQLGEYDEALQQFAKPSKEIGYAARLMAIENMAFIEYKKLQTLATAEQLNRAKTALYRAVQAGSQNPALLAAYQSVSNVGLLD